MHAKKKICFGCEQERLIWKNFEGNKYCLYCYLKANPPIKKFIPTPIPKPVIVHEAPAKVIKFKPIKQRSDKRSAEEKEYGRERQKFLRAHKSCVAKLSGCKGRSCDIHHMKGRIGTLLLEQKYWISVCRECHEWIENNPKDAKLLGLSLSRLETQHEQIQFTRSA
jgi:hypothetical protein